MNNKYKIYKSATGFVLCALLLTGCSKVPRKYIQPDEMKVIMWELMFADKITGGGVLPGIMEFSDSMSQEYSKVLKYHDVSQKKFVESLQFYQSNPDVQKALYDSIYNYGNRMMTVVQNRIKIRDSIKAAIVAEKLRRLKPDSLRRDSIRRDSLRIDSLRKDSLVKVAGKDTLKRSTPARASKMPAVPL